MRKKAMRATAALMIVFFCALTARGQSAGQPPPPPGPGPGPVPEELVEEGIRKVDNGDAKEAGVLLERARRIKPDIDRSKLLYGLILIQANQTIEAIARLDEYNRTRTGETDYRGFAELGKLYKRSRLFTQAVRPLERAKELAPLEVGGKAVRSRISLDYAIVLNELKRSKKALDVARDAERDSPGDPQVKLQVAEISEATKDYAQALRSVDAAIDLGMAQMRADPFKPEMHELLISCYDFKIKMAAGLRGIKPGDFSPIYLECRAVHAKSDIVRRASLLRVRDQMLQIVAKDSKQIQWRIFLAQVEYELGGLQEALDRLKGVLQDDPKNEEALKLRAEIQARYKPATGG